MDSKGAEARAPLPLSVGPLRKPLKNPMTP